MAFIACVCVYIYIYIYVSVKIMPYLLLLKTLCAFSNFLILFFISVGSINYIYIYIYVLLHAGGVLNCNLSHRRSVAVLCMLYKIRCNPMHSLCGALPVPYVPVLVTRGALIANRYTFAPPRCKTSQYRRTLDLSGTIWLTPYSMLWDWRVSRAGPMPFC